MIKTKTLLAAIVLDALVGDPEFLPHPARVVGASVATGERLLRPLTATPARDFAGGALLSTIVIGSSFLAGRTSPSLFGRRDGWTGRALEMWLAQSVLAARNLADEANAVLDLLDAGDLASSRRRLARIVGRDTKDLDAAEISRAVVETVAESFCDGVIAPLFYLTLGGTPAALAYKAANTLDSMIGHKEPPHLYFGRFAAKLDDIVNFIPARLGAVLICAAARFSRGASASDAWRIWLRDGDSHASPNAGQTEASMAGALRVRLGGRNFYDGAAHEAPTLGFEFESASPVKARKAIKLMIGATLIGYSCAVVVSFIGRKNDR